MSKPRLYVLYSLQPIGVDGTFEATDTQRFCCPACRNYYMQHPQEENFQAKPENYYLVDGVPPAHPGPEAPVVVKEGEEDWEMEGEVCSCGQLLEHAEGKRLVIGLRHDKAESWSTHVRTSDPQTAADALHAHNDMGTPDEILLVVEGPEGPEVGAHWNVGKEYEEVED